MKKDREWKLAQASKKISRTKEIARDFLKSAGIMTKDGKLHPRYRHKGE